MKYDFTTVVNRKNTGSIKWEGMKRAGVSDKDEIVPLSMADMEFDAVPQIRKALADYAQSAVFGYTKGTAKYYDAVTGWMRRRHGWEVSADEITISNGVVPAICTAVRALTEPGDGVLVMTPVYYPFFSAAEKNARTVVGTRLIEDGNTYRIDFEDFAAKAAMPETKLLILCNPHNPVGRVWTRGELEKIADICRENDLFVVSDEIHGDLIMPGNRHTVFASVSPDAASRTVTCTAPSKSFNLAGLSTSNIIFKNKELQSRYLAEATHNFYPEINCFGYRACETAYSECEDWLDEAIAVIDSNRKLAEDFLRERVPEIKPFKLEGTYLLWLDCRALGMDATALERFMQRDALLFLDEGYLFGAGGEGFERVNLACPQSVLQSALERLEKAVKSL